MVFATRAKFEHDAVNIYYNESVIRYSTIFTWVIFWSEYILHVSKESPQKCKAKENSGIEISALFSSSGKHFTSGYSKVASTGWSG